MGRPSTILLRGPGRGSRGGVRRRRRRLGAHLMASAEAEILLALAASGVELRVVGSDILFRPKSRVTSELAARIARAKPRLIALLGSLSPCTGSSSTGGIWMGPGAATLLAKSVVFTVTGEGQPRECRLCFSTRWWRRRPRGGWTCAECHPADHVDPGLIEWMGPEDRHA